MNLVIKIDRGIPLKACVGDHHLTQRIIRRGIGCIARQHFIECILRCNDFLTIGHQGIYFIDFQLLNCGIVHDECLPVKIVKCTVRVQFLLLYIPVIHTSVNIQCVFFNQGEVSRIVFFILCPNP